LFMFAIFTDIRILLAYIDSNICVGEMLIIFYMVIHSAIISEGRFLILVVWRWLLFRTWFLGISVQRIGRARVCDSICAFRRCTDTT
jgi:hypothetical protein